MICVVVNCKVLIKLVDGTVCFEVIYFTCESYVILILLRCIAELLAMTFPPQAS